MTQKVFTSNTTVETCFSSTKTCFNSDMAQQRLGRKGRKGRKGREGEGGEGHARSTVSVLELASFLMQSF